MSKKVRGHTAVARNPKPSKHEAQQTSTTTPNRPQTSLGFERDLSFMTRFLADQNSVRKQRSAYKNESKGLRSPWGSPFSQRKVAPLSKVVEKYQKNEEKWEKIRAKSSYSTELKRRITRSRNSGRAKVFERTDSPPKQRPISPSKNHKERERISSTTDEQNQSRPKRQVTKAWSVPYGFRRNGETKTKSKSSPRIEIIKEDRKDIGRHSSQDKDSPDAGETFITHSNISTRSNILSLQPLNSIIEAGDQIRRVESDTSSHVTQLSKSTEKISLDDVSLQESDESCYDTDLEEDFPAPPPKEYDPTERNTYIEACLCQGIVPVNYIVKRLGNRELVMRYHGLGPHGTRALATALIKNTCIEELDLTDNDLQADGGIFIALTLYENFYITRLDLSSNFLRADGGISLAKVLLTNTSLRRVILRNNHLTDRVAKAFAETLKENRSLSHLDLSNNEFGELGGLYLGAGLGLNYGLETLDLSWNSIRNKGAVSMAAALKTNDSLKRLDLSWNGLAFVGALAFTRHLKKNETLRELDISNTRIGPKGAQRIATALRVNTALQIFKIGLNPIGDDGVQAILNAVEKNLNIKFLSLKNITVSPKVNAEILRLESERDIVIETGRETTQTQEELPPSGIEILVQFIQDQRMRLKEFFFQFDKDHSGDITRSEFKTGLKETGIQMTDRQLDALIESIDLNNDNKIDYHEIIHGRDVVMKERRFQRKVAVLTEQREKESIQLPQLKAEQYVFELPPDWPLKPVKQLRESDV